MGCFTISFQEGLDITLNLPVKKSMTKHLAILIKTKHLAILVKNNFPSSSSGMIANGHWLLQEHYTLTDFSGKNILDKYSKT